MALVVTPLEDQVLTTEPLWREDWFVALPEDHPLAGAERLTCADLAHADLILAHADFAPNGHEQVRDAFRAAGITPRVVVRARRLTTMLMLVATGTGATFVPASVAAKQIAGVVTRPFVAEALIMMAAYRAENPPGLAMQFLRIAREIIETMV